MANEEKYLVIEHTEDSFDSWELLLLNEEEIDHMHNDEERVYTIIKYIDIVRKSSGHTI